MLCLIWACRAFNVCLLWKNGITSFLELTVKYKVGIMFIIVTKENVCLKNCLAVVMSVSTICIKYFKSWLKKETYWVCGDIVSCKGACTAIRTMLRDLLRLWPHKANQGWENPQNHEQLHVPDDIDRNGAYQNDHTIPSEHNHIFHIKQLVHATQRCRETLDQQIADHALESYVIDYVYQGIVTGTNYFFPEMSTYD
jgi:hypothetical protein